MDPLKMKSRSYVLGALLVVLYTFLLTNRISNPDLVQQGDKYLRMHQFAKAFQAYRSALASDDIPSIHLKFGQAYLLLKNFDAAADHFQQVLSADPNDRTALLGMATAQVKARNYDKAEEILQTLFRQNSTDRESRELLGAIRLRQENLEGASLLFERILAEDPSDDGANLGTWVVEWLNSGAADDTRLDRVAMSEDADTSQLGQDLKTAITQANESPGNGYPEGLLGMTFLKHGEPEIAKLFLERSLKQNPGYAGAQTYLGLSLLSLGDHKSAVQVLQDTVANNPTDVLATYSLGLALRAQRRYDEAIDVLEKALELAPEESNIYQDLGATYALLGDYSSAEKQFIKAAELSPSDIEANLSLTGFYLDRGLGVEKGLEAAQKAYDIDGNNVEALAKLGWAFYLNGNEEEGEQYLLKALSVSDDFAPAHYYLGVLEAKRGNITDSSRELQNAVDLDPTSSLGRRAARELADLQKNP